MLLTVEWNPRPLLVTLAVVTGGVGWHFTSRRDNTEHALFFNGGALGEEDLGMGRRGAVEQKGAFVWLV